MSKTIGEARSLSSSMRLQRDGWINIIKETLKKGDRSILKYEKTAQKLAECGWAIPVWLPVKHLWKILDQLEKTDVSSEEVTAEMVKFVRKEVETKKFKEETQNKISKVKIDGLQDMYDDAIYLYEEKRWGSSTALAIVCFQSLAGYATRISEKSRPGDLSEIKKELKKRHGELVSREEGLGACLMASFLGIMNYANSNKIRASTTGGRSGWSRHQIMHGGDLGPYKEEAAAKALLACHLVLVFCVNRK